MRELRPNCTTMRSQRTAGIVMAVGVLIAGACSSTESADPEPTPTEQTVPAATEGRCDPLDRADCLLPWPNDRFTRPDPSTSTGLRVDLPADGTPTNSDGVVIGVDEWNRNDGFSPAAIAMTVIPGVDIAASRLPPVTDIGSSLDEDSSLVLWDVDAGERVPAWVELDSEGVDPDRTPLLINPATSLLEGHRHVVALRELHTAEDEPIPAERAYLDGLETPDSHTAAMVDGLKAAGLDPSELTTAWTFTVSSGESLSGRLRHMWNETSAEMADSAPSFTVDAVDIEADGPAQIVRGTFESPNYLTGDGSTGSVLNNGDDPDGIPERNGSLTTDFICTVPAAASGDDPGPVILYGHGLLGSQTEVLGLGALGAALGISFCALDWIGMSAADVPTVVETLGELTAFRTQPDRMQQGHLGWLLLGRLLSRPDGFATDPAFQDDAGSPIIDPAQLSFLGASQGGILGAAPSALTDDWTQVVLAVPGLGYNLLLPRSIDFDEFAPMFESSYPDPLDRSLTRELMEMLWDRGENAGWAQHLVDDTYDAAPAKNVLLLEAFGDHQVANVSTEKLARTLGLSRVDPTLAEGRSTDVAPFFGIPALPSIPAQGSGLVVWDFGTPAPPVANVPPREGDDPHGKLSDVPDALLLVATFTQPDGPIIDVCGGEPCRDP